MGTWRQHKGELHARPRAFSKASAQMVRMQCVLYPPDNARCRADSGQVGDSQAGFGHCGHCRADSGHKRDLRATFHHFEHSERPNVARESLQCLNLARQRFQCPDIARQRAACPDSARRRQVFTGTKRARKKFPSPYSVNGRKRRSARVAMRRARGILTHKSLDELSPNHIEHL